MSPARVAFKHGVAAAVQMIRATQPGLRKGLLQDQKEADLAQLVESNLQLGDLAPLVCLDPLAFVWTIDLAWRRYPRTSKYGYASPCLKDLFTPKI
jgi:hypothetical protein